MLHELKDMSRRSHMSQDRVHASTTVTPICSHAKALGVSLGHPTLWKNEWNEASNIGANLLALLAGLSFVRNSKDWHLSHAPEVVVGGSLAMEPASRHSRLLAIYSPADYSRHHPGSTYRFKILLTRACLHQVTWEILTCIMNTASILWGLGVGDLLNRGYKSRNSSESRCWLLS